MYGTGPITVPSVPQMGIPTAVNYTGRSLVAVFNWTKMGANHPFTVIQLSGSRDKLVDRFTTLIDD